MLNIKQQILFVVPYPHGVAPSQRFRFEQYLSALTEAGYTYKIEPFLDINTWAILYKPGHSLKKVIGIIAGFFRRIVLLFGVCKYDFIFIHREATPIGPPWFEWFVANVLKKKIIYDFDDAIWISNTSEVNKIVAKLKWHQKVGQICKWSYKISCGNSYLQSYAKCYNPNSFINPTTIDTVGLHNMLKDQNVKQVVIGWTGTHSTMKYIDPLLPALKKLENEFEFYFVVISNRKPDFYLKSLMYLPWNKDTEISDLLKFNIGVMPLIDDLWSNGKCAFKALQYMSLGIPAVVSPVGMNSEVVDNNINGFICESSDDWYEALKALIEDLDKRKIFGMRARKKIVESYAVVANRDNFLRFFT